MLVSSRSTRSEPVYNGSASSLAGGTFAEGVRPRAASEIRAPAAKEKVPSDPCPSRTPHRHTRLEPRQTGQPDDIFFAPRLSDFERCGSTLQSSPAALPCSELTLRNGLSLTRNEYLLPDRPLRGRRSRPASSAPAEVFLEPARLMTRPLHPVGPGSGGVAITRPLPDSHFRVFCDRRASTPLEGFLVLLGSQRSTQPAAEKLTLTNCPISLRSPPACSFLVSRLRINVPGSLPLIRFGCFMNLLEP